jgi:hypothetical protein
VEAERIQQMNMPKKKQVAHRNILLFQELSRLIHHFKFQDAPARKAFK